MSYLSPYEIRGTPEWETVRPGKAFVYAVRVEDTIKIGMTCNLLQRLMSYRCRPGYECLGFVLCPHKEVAQRLETDLLSLFKPWRLMNCHEYFELEVEPMVKTILHLPPKNA